MAARKTHRLKQAVSRQGFNGLVAGTRREEQAMRAKERVFSPRAEDIRVAFGEATGNDALGRGAVFALLLSLSPACDQLV